MSRFARLTTAAALFAGIGTLHAGPITLRFIGQQTVALGTTFSGTTIGGISGLEYVGGNSFLALSDDRSQINPARFYGISLDLTSTSFSGVTFNTVTTLKDPSGNPYPALSIDPESIRRLPNGNLLYTSEGDVNNNINAFIREALPDGTFVRDYTIPANFQQTGPAGTTGIRQNLAFESLTLGGPTTFTATENALRQDGPAAALGVGSSSRILSFDTATGVSGAQYVYQVNPVAQPPVPAGQFSTNGLVELLFLQPGQFLALERSFSVGVGNSVQLYYITTAGATDVSGLSSLDGQAFTPVTKELLLDLNTLGFPLDNLEAITFGPTLENGKRSFIIASDDNFATGQFTQFLAFEVTEVPEPSTFALVGVGFAALCAVGRRRRG